MSKWLRMYRFALPNQFLNTDIYHTKCTKTFKMLIEAHIQNMKKQIGRIYSHAACYVGALPALSEGGTNNTSKLLVFYLINIITIITE